MSEHRKLIAAIMLAVVAWGTVQAIGAYRFNHNPWRAVMVLSCVGAFLGFWGILLARQSRGPRRLDKSPNANLRPKL